MKEKRKKRRRSRRCNYLVMMYHGIIDLEPRGGLPIRGPDIFSVCKLLSRIPLGTLFGA